jgi:ACR3 family arsenite transporter
MMEAAAPGSPTGPRAKRLNVFERWLSLWVALCMVAGIALGKLLPAFTDAARRLEFGEGSQINIPIAVLLWLMIYPMMLRIDLASVLEVRRRPRGILVVLFVNSCRRDRRPSGRTRRRPSLCRAQRRG